MERENMNIQKEIYKLPRAADGRVRELKDLGFMDAVWYYSPEDPTEFVVKYTMH